MKTFLIGLCVLLVGISGAVALQRWKGVSVEEEKMRVVASFYPLAEWASRAGEELVNVHVLAPAGIDPHTFEPTPRELALIYNASVFLFVGGGFEPWAERLEEDLKKRGVTVLEMEEYMEFFRVEEEEHEEEEEEHGHGAYDPHFWLDPTRAAEAVRLVGETFSALDPDNTSAYEIQAAAYMTELEQLHHEYEQGLVSCAKNEIIVAHDAFRYMADRYGFDIIAIAGISPEEEPSLRRMGELVLLAREKNIRYIFFETLASTRLSETIAQEVGAQTLVLNPIEGLSAQEESEGHTYISLMRQNLTNLRLALECS
ncbi:MAG: zinc ABC transporter substrate-binding protein [Candidatus Yanofskybacteria bacterium]|nr:zinc ABC transporter substrate-binding protein [Candidatus Yanofskybacteria bacterium]